MDPRTGTVVNGRIVLDDGDGLVEGARVTVLLDDDVTDAPVTVDAAELEAIDEGHADAARGDLLDARTFLAELRRDGSTASTCRGSATPRTSRSPTAATASSCSPSGM